MCCQVRIVEEGGTDSSISRIGSLPAGMPSVVAVPEIMRETDERRRARISGLKYRRFTLRRTSLGIALCFCPPVHRGNRNNCKVLRGYLAAHYRLQSQDGIGSSNDRVTGLIRVGSMTSYPRMTTSIDSPPAEKRPGAEPTVPRGRPGPR